MTIEISPHTEETRTRRLEVWGYAKLSRKRPDTPLKQPLRSLTQNRARAYRNHKGVVEIAVSKKRHLSASKVAS